MAKQQTIEISGINLVTQPHSPEGYVSIFEYIKQHNPHFSVHGNDHIQFTHIKPLDEKNMLNGIKGQILKFSHIDQDSAWVNIASGEALDGDDAPKIPPEKQPNGSYFDFVFYPSPSHKENNHKLLYVSKYRDPHKKKTVSLSPLMVNRFFEQLIRSSDFQDGTEFKTVDATVIPQKDALQEMLRLDIINKIEIVIKAPNADVEDYDEVSILERMENINVSQIQKTFLADNRSIKPDAKILKEAKIASENGFVKIEGEDNIGNKVKKSTTDVPMRVRLKIDTIGAIKSILHNFKL